MAEVLRSDLAEIDLLEIWKKAPVARKNNHRTLGKAYGLFLDRLRTSNHSQPHMPRPTRNGTRLQSPATVPLPSKSSSPRRELSIWLTQRS